MAVNYPAWGGLSFFAHSGATTANNVFTPKTHMVIQGNGNVGIGTSKPVCKLDVNGDSVTRGNFILEGTNKWIFHTPDDGRTTMYIAPWNGKNDWIWGVLTLQRDGKIGIGTNAPGDKLDVQGGNIKTSGTIFWNNGASRLTPDQGGSIELGSGLHKGAVPYIDFHYGMGKTQDFNMRIINDRDKYLTITGGDVTIAGKLWARSVQQSDIREKKEIADLGRILNKLITLRGVSFKWKDQKRGVDSQYGLIA